MCGILGIVSKTPLDEALLIRMRDTMTHRGPDGAGVWLSQDRTIGLAHRRLAIIDLSPSAAQPMRDTANELILTFNGEIYNFLALRRELEILGHVFRTCSDTEVILQAYRAWGLDLLPKLDGMFAFALYDARAGRMFLARDRAGEKPLFYSQSDRRLVFASELKAMMADPSFPRRLNLEALDLYLAFGYVPGDRCILEGVHKLRAGEAMTYDCQTRNVKIWRYWRLPETSAPASGPSEHDLVAELQLLLEHSVRDRLVADVPVGILLSGGIDSSLVTAVAAKVSSRAVKTFTIHFPGHPHYDEGPYARAIADHFGTEHTELNACETPCELLPALARQFDEPIADSSLIPTYLAAHLVRRHAAVALGGDGGDELFGGYVHYNVMLAQNTQRRYLPNCLRAPLSAAAGHLLPAGFHGRNYLLQLGADCPEGMARMNSYFDPVLRARLMQPGLNSAPTWPCVAAETYKSSHYAARQTLLQNATAIDFTTYLPDDILTKVDRASMLTSLEVRAPWLDHKIIEFAFTRVPDRLRATITARKILPKLLAHRLLPGTIDLARKQGFSIPLCTWRDSKTLSSMIEILRGADNRIFRRKTIDSLIAGQHRKRSTAHQLFALAMFSLWQAEYDVSL
ncbi:MAG TPA: asparagine synthase (glutamine-hydrolyzing) [Bryobacteraceae bacterium]|nr:asparagine synthase (glutamine-hydrolyzing) [Bryobacteraceae bacterium]